MKAESKRVAVLTEKLDCLCSAIERLHECANSYVNGLGPRAGITLKEMKIMIDELNNMANEK